MSQQSLFGGPPAAYYNTNRETGLTLVESREKALTQEQKVRALMRDGTARTAWQVLDALVRRGHVHQMTPVTSIRRAVTNLYDRGYLDKLAETAMGPLGKQCHKYIKTDGNHNDQ